MQTLIRSLRMLAIVVWVGGIVFFAFVLAPVAFSLLPSQHIAGIVVGGTLRILHIIGLVCGAVFWVATILLYRRSARAHRRGYEVQIVLASAMILATAYLQASVLPAMERDRLQAGGEIEVAPPTSPAKVHFERLHQRSEQVEGAILFCGLAIVLLMAREPVAPNALKL